MKTLKLNDGKTFSITDGSTVNNITFVLKSFSEAELITSELTIENLKNIEINSVSYSNLRLITANAIYNGDNVTLTINLQEMGNIEIISKEITELQEAVAELAAGGIN